MAVRTGPAGYAFTALRIFQIMALIATIPLLSIFLVLLDRLGAVPPYQLVFSVIVSLPAFVYIVVTLIQHLIGSPRYTPVIIIDAVISCLLLVASLFIGLPVGRLDCAEVSRRSYGLSTLEDVDYDQANLTYSSVKFGATKIDGLVLPPLGKTYEEGVISAGKYVQWVGRVGGVCAQMKGALVGTLILVIMLAASAGVAWRLRWHVRRIPEFDDDEEEMSLGVMQMHENASMDQSGSGRLLGRVEEEDEREDETYHRQSIVQSGTTEESEKGLLGNQVPVGEENEESYRRPSTGEGGPEEESGEGLLGGGRGMSGERDETHRRRRGAGAGFV